MKSHGEHGSHGGKVETHKKLYEELTDRIIGLAIEVHKTLGPGFMESILEGRSCK